MANNSITGTIDLKNRTFTFGTSDEDAPCYKNPNAFKQSTEQICYIPENGAVTEVEMLTYSLDDATTYKYSDFEKLIDDFLRVNYPSDLANIELVIEWEQRLFDACQWQDPSTIIDEWERNMFDEEEEKSTLEDMQEYVSNFDWNQNTELLKKVYAMLP